MLLKAVTFLTGFLSWRRAQRLGGALGLLWFHAVRIRRRVVMGNLEMALSKTGKEARLIAREAYRHFGTSFFELLKIATMSPGEMASKVRARGMEHYERARARGRGVIVVTAHFGNFDLLAFAEAALGIPLAIVSRDLHEEGANRFWMATRRKSGLEIFPERGAARRILEWLRLGYVIGLTVDQRLSEEKGGILSEFMGWRVWTTTAPASLALASGAALLPVRVERCPDGGHTILVEPEIVIDRARDADARQQVTDRINKIVETWVRERPDHWLWLHRRFVGARRNRSLSHGPLEDKLSS
jgi:Kdo2-lipid IVA lauroyltransferase/acyltransferase